MSARRRLAPDPRLRLLRHAQHHRHRQRDRQREQPALPRWRASRSSSRSSSSTRPTATPTASGPARASRPRPTEAQWQAMKAAQHLALLQPVSTTTLTTLVHDDLHHQPAGGDAAHPQREAPGDRPQRPGDDGGRGLRRPVGRDQGRQQRHRPGAVDLRAPAAAPSSTTSSTSATPASARCRCASTRSAATNLEFHADSQTGTLLGKCAVAATGGAGPRSPAR